MNKYLLYIIRLSLLFVMSFCCVSCDIIEGLFGCGPIVDPGENYIKEYNPAKAGADIVGKYNVTRGDKAILKDEKLYILGGSGKTGVVSVYTMTDTTPDCICDVTFDIDSVLPSYRYYYGECIIPVHDKIMAMVSVSDGTNDQNVIFSMEYDGSDFVVMDISADFIRLDSVKYADYIVSENQLYIYSDNYTYYNDGLILSLYSYNKDKNGFNLINFFPASDIIYRNDKSYWSLSTQWGDIVDHDWLVFRYLSIDYYDNAVQDCKICLSYLDFDYFYFRVLYVFTKDDYIWLFAKYTKENRCELIKLKLL